MRLIDADALEELFREVIGGIAKRPEINGNLEHMIRASAMVVEMIKDAPTIEPEPHWIPCSERLPEVHEAGNSFSGIYMQSYPVLAYGVPEGEEECGFYVATYCDDLNGCTYWCAEIDAVTINGVNAWQPLPSPYREEADE